MVELIRKTKKFFKKEDGEVDKLVVLMFLFLMLSIFISFAEPFFIRNKVSLLTKEVVEEVEYTGKVDDSLVTSLIGKYGLDKYNPTFQFSGQIMPGGKIQLRDEFSFNIKIDYVLHLANLGEKIKIPLPISKTQTGRSQVYYRPSELGG